MRLIKALCFSLLLAACPAFGQATRPGCSPNNVLGPAGTCTIANTNGAFTVTLEEIPSGSPTTVSITVQGCGIGTTCDAAADTNTATTAANRAVTFTKVYDYFLVTAGTLSGGTSPKMTINPIVTTANSHSVGSISSGVVIAAFTGCSGTQYLGADGACHNAGGSGTVTSVATGTGLTGGPVTTSGTVSLTVPVTAANGGTGSTSVPTAAQVAVGNAGGTAYAPVSISGDSSLTSTGAMKNTMLHLAETAITNASSPYTVLATDSVITCDATAGAVTINLPAATGSGRQITVKKTDSSANACTPTRAGADLIDGATSYSLTVQYAASSVVDTASAVWSRTHVNQLLGDVSGASVANTVNKINGTALSGLATGILKNTTGTGVPSIAVGSDLPAAIPITSVGSAGLSGSTGIAIASTGVISQALTFDNASTGLAAPTGNTSFTWPSGNSFTVAGGSQAASVSAFNITGTPFTGGTATTNFPLAYLNCNGSTGPTTYSANGTFLGINTCTGFTGNYIDFHLNGAGSNFSVSSTGNVIASTSFQSGGFKASAAGTAVTFQSGFDSTTTTQGAATFKGGSISGTATSTLSGGAATFQGGDNAGTGTAETAGAATLRGGDVTGVTANNETAGALTARGGNVTATGTTSTPGLVTITGGSIVSAATNVAGANTLVQGGLGTGTATPAQVKLQAPTLGLASGSTAQTQVTFLTRHAKAGSTTSATATTMFNVASATNTAWGIDVLVHVDLISSTPNVCGTTERFSLTGTNNNGAFGTVNIVAGTLSTLCSAGTLTLAVSCTAANPSVCSVTPTWATITAITSDSITVVIENPSQQEIALL